MIRIADGEVAIWWARLQDVTWKSYRLLDDVERARFEAYQAIEDRQRFMGGCALIKLVASCYSEYATPLDVRISRTCFRCGKPHGKPELEGSSLNFSLSHSGGVIGLAVSLLAVGLDVEQVTYHTNLGEMAEFMLSRGELMTKEYSTARDYFIAWTRKEAVVKALGVGFQIAPNTIVVSSPRETPKLLEWPLTIPPETLRLFNVDVEPGYVSSLATIGSCRSLNYYDGSPLFATS